MIRNNHWYNLNELRPYPVDDIATITDNDGAFLPHNIIADIQLKFPNTAGTYAFLSSVTVTEMLVTVTIQAADSLDGDAGFTPLAVFTQTAPFRTGVQLPLEGQQPGVGGWIVLGSGVQEAYRGRFSIARQSVLGAKSARAYRPFPVSSLSKVANLSPLTGVVTMIGSSPVEVVGETRDILGEERDVIVVRLVQPANQPNVFEQFAGPCAGRPESETCGDPVPVEFINTVAPDCSGNLNIVFQGCGEISRLVGNCGVVVDCDLGLSQVCNPNNLPDSDGKLPNEYDDACDVPEEPPGSLPSISSSESSASSISESSISVAPGVECTTPYFDDFTDGTADDFTVLNGEFVIDPPAFYATEGPTSGSIRNIAVWDCEGGVTTEKKVTVVGKMMPAAAGVKHNMGVIINHRAHATIPGRVEYYLMDYDLDTATFRLLRFNGTIFQNLVSAVVGGIALDELIELEARIVSGPGFGQVSITIELTGIDNAAAATLGPVVTNAYLPDDGLFGLHALRANTRFRDFAVDVHP